MKRFWLIFLLLSLGYTSSLWGQGTTLQASINADKLIELSEDRPEEIPLGQPIWMDVRHLGFQNAQQVEQFFGGYMDNRIAFEVNFDRREVGLVLQQDDYTVHWTLADWNLYLRKKAAYAPGLGN